MSQDPLVELLFFLDLADRPLTAVEIGEMVEGPSLLPFLLKLVQSGKVSRAAKNPHLKVSKENPYLYSLVEIPQKSSA